MEVIKVYSKKLDKYLEVPVHPSDLLRRKCQETGTGTRMLVARECQVTGAGTRMLVARECQITGAGTRMLVALESA